LIQGSEDQRAGVSWLIDIIDFYQNRVDDVDELVSLIYSLLLMTISRISRTVSQ